MVQMNKIELDTTGLERALKDVNRTLHQMNRLIEAINANLLEATKSMQDMNEKLDTNSTQKDDLNGTE